MVRNIAILSADRAERGLFEPVMAELKLMKDVNARWFFFSPTIAIEDILKGFKVFLNHFKPDIILVPTDRFEMVYMAAYSFHNNIITCHFHAGNNPSNHPDDLNRRAISTFSHIMFANAPEHKENLVRSGEDPNRVHVVGSTAFDIQLDDSMTPKEPFDLVILHPDPLSLERTEQDLHNTLLAVAGSQKVVWIYPNHDKNFEIIERFLDNGQSTSITRYKNFPRSQYLSLLKNCSRAIGNSSSFYYEMPVLDRRTKLVQIGERNRGLIVPSTVVVGSERIAMILASIVIDDNLRRKKINLCGVV